MFPPSPHDECDNYGGYQIALPNRGFSKISFTGDHECGTRVESKHRPIHPVHRLLPNAATTTADYLNPRDPDCFSCYRTPQSSLECLSNQRYHIRES